MKGSSSGLVSTVTALLFFPRHCVRAVHWSFCVLQEKTNKKKTFSKRKSDLPRAQWTKPKYLCLRKSCSHGDDSLSRAHQQSTWLPGPSLSVCFWYFCTEGWKQLTYYLIIRKCRDLGNCFCFYISVETSLLKKVLIHLFLKQRIYAFSSLLLFTYNFMVWQNCSSFQGLKQESKKVM